jgi:hypothetical protein
LVVRVSTPDFEHVPDPGKDGEDSPFDFSSLNAETTEPIADFDPPQVKKARWWESRPKGEKKSRQTRERKVRAMPPMPRGGLKPALTQMYAGIGMAVMPFDPACGRVVIENAESCAAALDELAKTNPAVRRVLLSLVTTSAWGAVIMAHAPILMAVAMHHVPTLREKQEKMVGEMAEMFANGFGHEKGENSQ